MATTAQLLARISLLESRANGIQNNATGAKTIANAAVPKTGGSISGALTVAGNVNVGGNCIVGTGGAYQGDFQGTINGKNVTGAQIAFWQNFVKMSATNTAGPTNANNGFNSGGFNNVQAQVNNVINQFNILLGKLTSGGYMN